MRIGTKPGAEVVRHRRRQDEPARLDPDDLVDVPAAEVHDDQVDDRRERVGIGQDRRDVLEDDARLGEVGDVADQLLDLLDLHDLTSACASPAASPLRLRPRPRGPPVRAVARAAAASPVAAHRRGRRGGGRRPPRHDPLPVRAPLLELAEPRLAPLRIARSGAAMKIDEYAPVATPMNIANAKSFSVSPPKSSNDRIGSSTTSEVFTERINTWFSE